MAAARSSPELGDLYRLADQLERDRLLAVADLRRRDHALAADPTIASAKDSATRLLGWLDAVAPEDAAPAFPSTAVLLARAVALLMGFCAMAGFLSANSRGLVNVFALLLFFVVLQFVLSLVSAVVLLRSLGGATPTNLPMHPAGWLARRSLPDARYLREAKPVLRLLLLRYGQEWGALFTFAAALAFVAVPAVSDFSFIWGSTFDLGAGFVGRVIDTLALPWAHWLPPGVPDAELLVNSRFHPALTDLDRAEIEGMRGWWMFLFLCLLMYALLPRVLLWLGSRFAYGRQLRRSFTAFPGAELVLARLAKPLVSTQGRDADAETPAAEADASRLSASPLIADPGSLLLDWSGALADLGADAFEELRGVTPKNRLVLGAGALREDTERIEALDPSAYRQLVLVVKSWEPPMAELADLLAPLQSISHCTVYLLPLPGQPVPERRIEDWRSFSRRLPFAGVATHLLRPDPL